MIATWLKPPSPQTLLRKEKMQADSSALNTKTANATQETKKGEPEKRSSRWPLALPSLNISRPVLIFDGWICQRQRQLETLESLNRGNCLTAFQRTSASQGKSEWASKLVLASRKGRKGRKWQGPQCCFSWTGQTCGAVRPRTAVALLTH